MVDRLAEIEQHMAVYDTKPYATYPRQEMAWLIEEVKRLRAKADATPKLYEALKRIVALSEDDEHEPTYAWKDAFEAAAAALAIADGEAHG